MKIAFLVLCHKNPNQLNLLLDKLLEFDSEIFIHIDKKNYKILLKINNNKRIHILNYEDCYDIKWGGMNMINATLKLIDKAKNSKIKFDYLWLLSGQDYLLTSVTYINKFLINNIEYNFINYLPHDKKYLRHKKLYTLCYPIWMSENKVLCKIIKRIYMLITGGFKNTFKFIDRSKKYKINVEIGSQWWTLKSECAYFILDYCKTNPNHMKFYEKCLIPDESFFQTIIYNSKYRYKCKENLTFVNWRDNNRSPEILTIKDLNLLREKSKKYFFARKFDIYVDDEIIKKLNY